MKRSQLERIIRSDDENGCFNICKNMGEVERLVKESYSFNDYCLEYPFGECDVEDRTAEHAGAVEALTDLACELQELYYEELYIEHNHGHLRLEDVYVDRTVEEFFPGKRVVTRIVTGSVIDGGEVSRLLGSTSYRHFPKGKEKVYHLHGRRPAKQLNGVWAVSTVSCG